MHQKRHPKGTIKKKSDSRVFANLTSKFAFALLSTNANLQTCWRGIHTSKYASIFFWRLQLLKARVFAVSSTNANMRTYLQICRHACVPANKRHSWRWRMQLPTNFAHFPPKDISGGTTRHNLLLTATASGNCRSLKSSDPSAFRPPGYLLRLEFAACLHLPVPRQFRRVRLECAAEKKAESSASWWTSKVRHEIVEYTKLTLTRTRNHHHGTLIDYQITALLHLPLRRPSGEFGVSAFVVSSAWLYPGMYLFFCLFVAMFDTYLLWCSYTHTRLFGSL